MSQENNPRPKIEIFTTAKLNLGDAQKIILWYMSEYFDVKKKILLFTI
jgi:hypothetical protein